MSFKFQNVYQKSVYCSSRDNNHCFMQKGNSLIDSFNSRIEALLSGRQISHLYFVRVAVKRSSV